MKKEYLLFGLMGCAVAILLWISWHFQRSQEAYFNTTHEQLASLQREVLVFTDHLDFIKTHENELNFLRKKGWFTAHNRLIAGDFLNRLGSILQELHFTFEPELATTLENKYHFKATQIILEGTSSLDLPFYDFLENLLTTFPGVVRLLEFSLTRGEDINTENPNVMKGKFIFEWFSMGNTQQND
jgi:hypothetical protein